jgi:NTP pyrophosphatase (non-canonical NTP hydrolase)
MEFNAYQEAAWATAIHPNRGNNVTYPVLGLVSEAGEVADKLKKMMRDEDGVLSEERRLAFSQELGDVLWYVAAIATELKLDFESIAEENLRKLKSRQERNLLHGTGDNR